MMDERFYYIARALSRTKRKEYENYVVNAIWNRLSTTEIKPVSQQYINCELRVTFTQVLDPITRKKEYRL